MADELPISAARADQHIVVKRCEVVRIQANRPHIHGRSPTRRTAFYSAPPCHGGVFDFRARTARLSTNIGAVSARNADDLRSTALRAGTYLPPGTESSNPPSSSSESAANHAVAAPRAGRCSSSDLGARRKLHAARFGPKLMIRRTCP